MKKAIHPNYNQIQVTCSCGNTFTTGSTTKDVNVEICYKCHPFWTGAEKFVDMEGRVDQFKRKQQNADKERQKRLADLKAKIARDKERKEAPKSLKDMLKSMQ